MTWHAHTATTMYRLGNVERAKVMIHDADEEPIVTIIAHGDTHKEACALAAKQAEILVLAHGLRLRDPPQFQDEAVAEIKAERELADVARGQ